MFLTQLKITHLRNLQPTSLCLHPNINFIHGDNGAGKTSILEAIFLLANSKSFRTNHIEHIIQQGEASTTVYAELIDDNESKHTIACQRDKSSKTIVKLNGSKSKLSEVIRQLAILEIGPRSTELFFSGPQSRRNVLNWGVFHVEHNFFEHWKLANRALKQRNALLKTYNKKQISLSQKRDVIKDDVQFKYWTQQLVEKSELIDNLRQLYINSLQPVMHEILQALTDDESLMSSISLRYKKGWQDEKCLQETLNNQLERDILSGYTSSGFHRADFVLQSENKPAFEVLSRGQLKLLIYALKLAQQKHMRVKTNVSPICLLDDIGSELDDNHYQKVMAWLSEYPTQVFVTSILANNIDALNRDFKMFHVEHGHVAEKTDV